ncbi:MAG: AP endonuclease [Flavobacteriaceae bacterium]|nr:AP endonuclease [Flavobacteriaceae bacterium]
MKTLSVFTYLTLLLFTCFGCGNSNEINIQDTYPWCIVAYDSLERTPQERIQMMNDLGFTKYAYDWRDRHLNNTKTELILAQENNIEILSVWLWLNPKRDSIHQLSPANEKMIEIVKELDIETTFWVGLSESYFKKLNQEESIELATNLIQSVSKKAKSIHCKVALYNHKGWFGNPLNHLEVIKALPNQDLSLVYNFHHGHQHINNFDDIAIKITPHLSAVNLNGMEKDGEKILPIGKGIHEKEMVKILQNNSYNGPWGILGHVEGVDVKDILINNIEGLKSLSK